MTVGQFAEACAQLRRQFSASETSAGRSDAHTVAVGGFIGDPHTWDLGRDFVYEHFPVLDDLKAAAAALGLKVIREYDATGVTHDHLQPEDFPTGPVTTYDGVTKDWV